MNSIPQVTFYGSSGHSYAVAYQMGFPGAAPRVCDAVAFIDDVRGGQGLSLGDVPIISWEEWQSRYIRLPCLVPIGDGRKRRTLVEKVAAAGGCFPRLYDAQQAVFPGIRTGVGTILSRPGYIGPNTVVGDHAQVMPMHSIGHDVVIGPYATLCPSATVSGHVVIEEAAYIGAGATIMNGRPDRPIVIGAGAVVAAGAVVTRSVTPGVTVMGNPARLLRDLARQKASST